MDAADWKCVVCLAIVGNKVRYKRLELDDSSFNAIILEFNGYRVWK